MCPFSLNRSLLMGFSDVPLMVHFPCRFVKEYKTRKQVHFLSIETVLRIRIEDPGSNAFLTPGSEIHIRDQEWGKKIRIRDEHQNHFSESLQTVFWV